MYTEYFKNRWKYLTLSRSFIVCCLYTHDVRLIKLHSTVLPSLQDPCCGWIDNYNGIAGIIVGVGKGLVHTIYSELNLRQNYIPVDVCIRGIIVATWYEIAKSNNK